MYEVAKNHYWALIEGERVWVQPDGNRFFNAYLGEPAGERAG
jgi:hypothetical protein